MNHDRQKLHSIKIATRGSPLALIQANYVKKRLLSQGVSSQLCQIKTTGDKILDKPLHEIGGKGVFIKELEKSLLRQETDIAVHSLKDLACVLDKKFKFLAYLPRRFFHDILVFPAKNKSLFSSLQGKEILSQQDFSELQPCTIGTGSLRRKALVQAAHKSMILAPIRGNINTRLAKLQSGDYDALLLSEASLRRLEISEEEFVSVKLDPLWFVPCTAQGIIAVESLADFQQHSDIFMQMSCASTKRCCELERGLMASLGGSCLLPIGIYFCLVAQGLQANIVVLSNEGDLEVRHQRVFADELKDENIIETLKKELIDKGVNKILEALGLEAISH